MKILKIFAVCFVLMNYSLFIFVCTSALSKTQMTTKTKNVNKLQTVFYCFLNFRLESSSTNLHYR